METKEINDFPKRATKVMGICKICYEKYYGSIEDREKKRKEANGALHARRVEKCKEYIKQHLQKNPCVDCGNDEWEVLEFDHIDPQCKNENISQIMKRGSLSVLEHEIEKCEVVCANCHKKRTNRQFGFWRSSGYVH
jgi:hypothetical protein